MVVQDEFRRADEVVWLITNKGFNKFMDYYISILIYSSCLLWPILLVHFFYQENVVGRVAVNLFSYFPTTFFAALRGNAGTDTPLYRELYLNSEYLSDVKIDFVFNLMQYLFNNAGFDFQIFAFAHAIFCWVSFSIGAAIVDRTAPVVSLGILPVIFLDSVFNGMRYGASFAVALLVIPYLISGNRRFGAVLALIPGLFHSSMFVLAGISRWPVIFVLLLGIGGVFDMGMDATYAYIEYKIDAYSDFYRPEWYSGIFQVFQILILLFYIKSQKIEFRSARVIFIMALIVSVLSFSLANISYASLRFLGLAIFLFAAAISLGKFNAKSRGGDRVLVLLAISSALNFLRQMVMGLEAGNVFFLPYDFFWQMNG